MRDVAVFPASRVFKLPAGWLLIALLWGASCLPAVGGQDHVIPTPLFSEVASRVGLDFKHFNGASGEYYLPEIVGPGAALWDYDGDGDLDVYLVQSAMLEPGRKPAQAWFAPEPGWKPGHRLFRNELIPQSSLGFTDVTTQAGVGSVSYGMGVAVGDYDNDGDLDLYLTNYGPNLLYRNNGDATFTHLKGAGADDSRWTTSAAFLDYDRDGDLDLFVTNYGNFTVEGNNPCHNKMGIRDYCGPSAYRPVPDRLFRNEGNSKFVDVTEEAGLGAAFGTGLGAVCADFDADGWTDIYVANDETPNQLWMNQGNGTFAETGLLSGTAFNADGNAEGSMGVTAADFNNDGAEDLFMTHLVEETHTLYLNDGSAGFSDQTSRFGLTGAMTYTGFGTEWFDYDNDGNLDLFVANGAVRMTRLAEPTEYPYHQINQLFHNDGHGNYRETTARAGAALQLSEVSRGAAFGDIDNDGDVDILVTNNNGPVRLLLNEVGSRRHWLQVQLQGVTSNRYGMGARVVLIRDGKKSLWRRAHTDGSYLSANDHRVHFGLGLDAQVKAVVVHWPGGSSEIWEEIQADQLLTLREGSGRPWSP